MRERYAAWVAAIAWVVPAAVAAGCTGSGVGSHPTHGPTNADVRITSRDIAFDRETLTAPAGAAWSLELVNEDSMPHNIAIYRDESATETLFVGELVTGTTIVYDVPALEPGRYFFRCDLHRDMKGTLIVRG